MRNELLRTRKFAAADRLRIAAIGAAWFLSLPFVSGYPALAQDKATTPPPAQVQELVKLLDDPAVRSWLEQARSGEAAPAPAPAPAIGMMNPAEMASRLSGVRQHLRTIIGAIPRFPSEFRRAYDLLLQELSEYGLLAILALIGAFVALGYGSEWVFRRATARTREWIRRHSMATLLDRLRMIGMRLGYGLTLVAIFGLGSIGTFLVLDWPPLLRQVIVAYLFAIVIVRLAIILGHVILVPAPHKLDHPECYRVIPIEVERARFWHTRLVLFIGYFVFGWMTVTLLGVFGFPPELRAAAAYILGLGLLGIAIEAIWRLPDPAEDVSHLRMSRTGLRILLTACGVLLWLIWVAGLTLLFWLVVVVLALPKAIALVQSAVSHLLRPSGAVVASQRSVWEVIVERGLRTLLIVAAVLFLMEIWDVDFIAMTARDTMATRLVRGALMSIVVLLLADFLWQVSKAAVDKRLADTTALSEPGTEGAVRQARIRTLLPIFRNILFVVIAVLAGLTALSALGVEIGPLIAGAGVFGVAVGFGAQTLVKDIISGIFYLLDDAFRVGEYIQSGSYKGTVESFSLRSVKLRHHRGPIYTVPFGALGAVQNMSRDWVIDTFMIGVTYGTDLEKARKIIKKIGEDLAEDPQFSKNIIEPLKMQGVEQFGDYAIQIRCKMMTRPGEQFVIRRKAYMQIKQAFNENGIQFATPTVQVAGGEEAAPAAARHVIERLSAGKPTAA